MKIKWKLRNISVRAMNLFTQILWKVFKIFEAFEKFYRKNIKCSQKLLKHSTAKIFLNNLNLLTLSAEVTNEPRLEEFFRFQKVIFTDDISTQNEDGKNFDPFRGSNKIRTYFIFWITKNSFFLQKLYVSSQLSFPICQTGKSNILKMYSEALKRSNCSNKFLSADINLLPFHA